MPKSDLARASTLERWLYWMLHAHEHTEVELMSLFPEAEFLQATQTLLAIKQITEDKQIYDATEKARRRMCGTVLLVYRRGLRSWPIDSQRSLVLGLQVAEVTRAENQARLSRENRAWENSIGHWIIKTALKKTVGCHWKVLSNAGSGYFELLESLGWFWQKTLR